MGAIHGIGHRVVELLLIDVEGIAHDLGQQLARAAGVGDIPDRRIGGVVVGPMYGAAAEPADTARRTACAGSQEQGEADENGAKHVRHFQTGNLCIIGPALQQEIIIM